jgi:hypothetical protein
MKMRLHCREEVSFRIARERLSRPAAASCRAERQRWIFGSSARSPRALRCHRQPRAAERVTMLSARLSVTIASTARPHTASASRRSSLYSKRL